MIIIFYAAQSSFFLNNRFPTALFSIYAAVYVAIMILFYRSAKTIQGRHTRAILTFFRIITASFILFLLLNPSFVRRKPYSSTEQIALMLDTSKSMTIADESENQTRFDLMQKIIAQNKLPDSLSEILPVIKYSFDSSVKKIDEKSEKSLSPEGETTKLLDALLKTSSDSTGRKTKAIVVFSDGAETSDTNFLDTIRELSRREIAVYPVPLGSDEQRKDIAISRIKVSKNVARDTEATIDVFIEQTGYNNVMLPVKLFKGGEVIESSGVLLESPTAKVTLKFTPKVEGLHTLNVVADIQDGEAFAENNSQIVSINSVKTKLNILYMEGTMYRIQERELWEYQYLEQAVREAPDMEIKTLFRDQTKEAYLAGVSWVQDPVNGFPTKKSELFKYDIIISSDIDLIYFTEEQLEWIVEFVEKHGGGYIMIGGWTSFGSGGYDESVIDKMLPVDMQGRSDGYFEGTSFKMTITPEGRKHPIFQIAPENNDAILDAMPYFRGCNRVQRAKPAATVLAEHPYYQTGFGAMPLIAVQEFGKGRVMAFVSDTTAGWGELFENDWGESGDNRYFRKFWQNAFRWLGQYRLGRPSKYILVETDKASYGVGEDIPLTVEVNDENFEPSSSATVKVRITSPAGAKSEIILSPDMKRPGKYTGIFQPAETGRYDAEAYAYLDGTQLDTDIIQIEVTKPNVEFTNYVRNDFLLERLARFTGGRVISHEDVRNLPEIIRQTQGLARHSLTEVSPMWDKLPFLLILFILLTAEWVLRKRAGLA